MINENFAHYSNLLIALALVAYTAAFLGYCAEWAFGSSSRIGAKAAAVGRQSAASAARGREEATMSVGASGVAVLTRTADEAEEPTIAGGSMRAEVVGRFAVMATVIGFALHASGVLFRGLAAHRVPWANMYEFSCAAALAMAFAYLVLLVLGKKVRWLGLPVSFIVLITLGLAYTVLYTDAEELVPALHSYWLYIHVTSAVLSTGAFGVATVATILYLLKSATEEGKLARLAGSAGARALLRDARPHGVPRHRVHLPAVDLRGDRGRDLGGEGLGPLLGLGPQGDLVVHRMGDLRGVPARAGDARLEGPRGGVDRVGRVRVRHVQLLWRQHVAQWPSQLRRTVSRS